MNKFFYELTKRNWGWGFHIVLANVLAIPFLMLYFSIWSVGPAGRNYAFVWLSVNAIGYAYEVYQGKKDPAAKEEFWEDVIANNLGIIIACLSHYLTRLF